MSRESPRPDREREREPARVPEFGLTMPRTPDPDHGRQVGGVAVHNLASNIPRAQPGTPRPPLYAPTRPGIPVAIPVAYTGGQGPVVARAVRRSESEPNRMASTIRPIAAAYVAAVDRANTRVVPQRVWRVEEEPESTSPARTAASVPQLTPFSGDLGQLEPWQLDEMEQAHAHFLQEIQRIKDRKLQTGNPQ